MTKNKASNVSVVENSETSSLMHCDFASDYVCYVSLMHCDFASDYVCYVSQDTLIRLRMLCYSHALRFCFRLRMLC